MSTNRRQHIVPQQMIRKFASEDGKLVEFFKPALEIGTKWKSPRGILYEENFYRDGIVDFDVDFLQQIEQRFAHYYPTLVSPGHPEMIDGKGCAALVDWIASMLCRTRAFVELSSVVMAKQEKDASVQWAIDAEVMCKVLRKGWFEELQDLFRRPRFKWKFRIFPDEYSLVISDNPVVQTNGLGPGGQVTIVPLSRHRVLFGGSEEAINNCKDVSAIVLNLFLAAYARERVYCADRETLVELKKYMTTPGLVVSDEWLEQAKLPLFGIVDRIKSRDPVDAESASAFWERVKNDFGPTVMP